MPTAARLISAILLALLGGLVSLQVMAVMPKSTDFGVFLPLNMALGVLVGWVWLGPNSGDGRLHGLSMGLTSAIVLTFLGLMLQSGNEMMRLAMANRYDGPFEAVAAIIVIALEFAQFFNTEIILTLVIGGCGAGLAADVAARRWT